VGCVRLDPPTIGGAGPSYARPVPAPLVVILTPLKDAATYLPRYLDALARLEHPADRLTLGFLESDSVDGTYDIARAHLPALRRRYRRVILAKRDYGFRIPPGVPRWAPALQIPRRAVLAKSRNYLLSKALRDEEWVLWLDVDVADYPPDILTRLLAAGKDIVTPHCVTRYGGPTFDWNAWRDRGRVRMDALRGGPELVRLDAVGATMLLVRADIHREGLVFPTFLYGRQSPFARHPNPWARRVCGEIETEGLALMAKDMGHECWGMPNLEIVHENR
jgi:glycosyltransferase involved in cell wall biosynthesis